MAKKQAEEGSFASDMRALLESGAGADLTLVAGDSQLPAHSHILAARSPVFAAMLGHEMQEAHSHRIVISDVQEAVLKDLLLFMYTDTTAQVDSMAAELCAASDKYNVPLLKTRCEQKMVQDICVDNAAARAALAVLHSCPLLKTAALDYIKAHPEVQATEGWAQVMRNNVEVGLEICKQLAIASPPWQAPLQSSYRMMPDEHKAKLAGRLMTAARNGHEGEVWALLHAGAPVDARDSDNNTALHLAARHSKAATVKCLLQGGADANAINTSKETPLHAAAKAGDVNIIWMLVAASARIDARNVNGKLPVDVATTEGGIFFVRTTLQLAKPEE